MMMLNPHPPLPRILLVEDNFLVAVSIKRMLEQCGCEVLGPIPTLEQGLSAAADEHLDGAVLDINIIGGTSAPVAAALRDRGCPFMFITGYGSPRILPESLMSIPRLSKPIALEQLAATLREVMA
jgi:DNA-binding NarL/FixJ family response regulator